MKLKRIKMIKIIIMIIIIMIKKSFRKDEEELSGKSCDNSNFYFILW